MRIRCAPFLGWGSRRHDDGTRARGDECGDQRHEDDERHEDPESLGRHLDPRVADEQGQHDEHERHQTGEDVGDVGPIGHHLDGENDAHAHQDESQDGKERGASADDGGDAVEAT